MNAPSPFVTRINEAVVEATCEKCGKTMRFPRIDPYSDTIRLVHREDGSHDAEYDRDAE